jgi:hypothetical protein
MQVNGAVCCGNVHERAGAVRLFSKHVKHKWVQFILIACRSYRLLSCAFVHGEWTCAHAIMLSCTAQLCACRVQVSAYYAR